MKTRPVGQHIILKLATDTAVADTPAKRRIGSRIVLKIGKGYGLLAFRFIDTHNHLEVGCSRKEAGECARRVEIALQRTLRPPAPFVPAYFEPIRSQSHLANTFKYIHTQAARHGVFDDPLCDGSNMSDLLGLRVIGGEYTAANVRRRLPRYQRADLLGFMGVAELQEVSFDAELDAGHIVAAACAAVGLSDLGSGSNRVTEARSAMLQVVGEALPTPDAASLLGLSCRSIRRLRHLCAPDALVAAIRRQLYLRRQLARSGDGVF